MSKVIYLMQRNGNILEASFDESSLSNCVRTVVEDGGFDHIYRFDTSNMEVEEVTSEVAKLTAQYLQETYSPEELSIELTRTLEWCEEKADRLFILTNPSDLPDAAWYLN